MFKRDELTTPGSCINKAADDEPVFVLRAHDPLAAATIRYWAALGEGALQQGGSVHSRDKIEQAKIEAFAMDRWRNSRDEMTLAATKQSTSEYERGIIMDMTEALVMIAEAMGYTIKIDPRIDKGDAVHIAHVEQEASRINVATTVDKWQRVCDTLIPHQEAVKSLYSYAAAATNNFPRHG